MWNIPDLQPITAGTRRSLVVKPPVTSAVWTSDESTSYQYQLNAKCQDFITRYLGRSLVSTTPDDSNMIHVNRELLGLAFTVNIIALIPSPPDKSTNIARSILV